MNNTELTISTSELVHWFNALRNVSDDMRYRALDSVWDGQITSKCWLVNTLNSVVENDKRSHNIYVFGGWTGILSNMLLSHLNQPVNKIRSIDIDPWCEKIADDVNKIHEMADWRFKAVTADMRAYEYEHNLPPDIVINTSSEHVDQETYDYWYRNIPRGTIVVVQGNNFFECSEHVRCTTDLTEFNVLNLSSNLLYTGSHVTSAYTRFMSIWRKP